MNQLCKLCLVLFCICLAVPIAARQGEMPMRTHAIIDQQQGGLVLATISVPVHWKVKSQVQWTWSDVSHPVRATARAEAPDGSAWVEFFPVEVFYWLEPVRSPVAVGARTLGMIHAPGIGVRDALQRFVVAAYRGRQPGLQQGALRRIDPARLLAAFGQPPAPGEAAAVRLRYQAAGGAVEEDVYAMVASGERIPYTGPQGTWYESHRPLVYAHALGARARSLDGMLPLLGFIAGSLKVDPAWQAHRQRVMQALKVEFDRYIARGYAQIQAAAQLSRTISANNDAMLASMQAERERQGQRDAARRAQAGAGRGPNESFSEYIRGVENMKDPYWGEADRSYHQRYHWTDGHGNYGSSSDSGFNPNVGAGGGVTWERMEPAR